MYPSKALTITAFTLALFELILLGVLDVVIYPNMYELTTQFPISTISLDTSFITSIALEILILLQFFLCVSIRIQNGLAKRMSFFYKHFGLLVMTTSVLFIIAISLSISSIYAVLYGLGRALD